MDRVARLIGFCLLLAMSGAYGYSSVPPKLLPVYDCNGALGETGPAACQAWLNKKPASTYNDAGVLITWTYKILSCSASSCLARGEGFKWDSYFQRNMLDSSWESSSSFSRVADNYGCPEFSTAVGGSGGGLKCECNLGFKPDGSACVPYACPGAGKYTAITQPDQEVANAGDGICQNGCGYTPTTWKGGSDGRIWATWPFVSTGKPCGGAKGSDGVATGELNTDKPAPVPCGANQCPGSVTMNGSTTQMCVACKGTSAPPSTESASAPAGSASGAGETTKTTQTTCDGVTCTTTSTTKDSSGTVVASTSKQEQQESFCAQNPSSPMCKKSSFGGSCAATSCDGDAVQCALAQETYKRNCQLYDDPKLSTMAEVGNAAMAGGDTPVGHPGAPGAVQAGSVSFSSVIDTSSPIAGSCPTSVTVAGPFGPLTMNFGSLCSSLAILGNIALALTWLACAFIVFR